MHIITKSSNMTCLREREEEGKAKEVYKHSQQSSHTLLLSSISALFPTSILLTLSEACCSMLRIQFLISEKSRSWVNISDGKAFRTKVQISKFSTETRDVYLLLKDDSSVTS